MPLLLAPKKQRSNWQRPQFPWGFIVMAGLDLP
jgi:hypothetical protein